MSDTVKFGYASSANITFRGEVDTGYPREEWENLSDKVKQGVIDDLVGELVYLWEIEGA